MASRTPPQAPLRSCVCFTRHASSSRCAHAGASPVKLDPLHDPWCRPACPLPHVRARRLATMCKCVARHTPHLTSPHQSNLSRSLSQSSAAVAARVALQRASKLSLAAARSKAKSRRNAAHSFRHTPHTASAGQHFALLAWIFSNAAAAVAEAAAAAAARAPSPASWQSAARPNQAANTRHKQALLRDLLCRCTILVRLMTYLSLTRLASATFPWNLSWAMARSVWARLSAGFTRTRTQEDTQPRHPA